MKDLLKKVLDHMDIIIPLLVLLIAVGMMHIISPSVEQASYPVPRAINFLDEYSRDGVNWLPITDDADLSSYDGDIYLRGCSDEEIYGGTRLYYYNNHVGEALYLDGELFSMDFRLEMKQYGLELQPSMCSEGWHYWHFEEGLPAGTEFKIHLMNPHTFGNRSAYEDFLTTLCFTANDAEYLTKALSQYSRVNLVLGVLFSIAGVMLLGSALAAAALWASVGPTLLKLGLLSGFAGGFFLLDMFDVNLWSTNNLFNTYGLQVCLMYAVYMLMVVAKDLTKGTPRKVARYTVMCSGVLNGILVLIAFFGYALIYDLQIYWVYAQLIFCPIMILCCVGELQSKPLGNRTSLGFFIVVFAAVVLDILGVGRMQYSMGNLTKLVFTVFFVYTFARYAVNIITDHKASVRAQELEQELEESRIAVMLSQIQPHFMFNVLGTLRGLCRENPEQAWVGLGDFSSYLRGNMNALTNERFIPFENELRHVEAYLRLEKMRLGERMSVIYDIQEKNFSIPPLTLQPLVENAVKHGLFYKPTNGVVIIHSRREGDHIIISVVDDGVGFGTDNPVPDFEQHSRVGLSNVRNRVEKMLGGTLRVDSSPDCGATVTVEFPVEGHEMEGV